MELTVPIRVTVYHGCGPGFWGMWQPGSPLTLAYTYLTRVPNDERGWVPLLADIWQENQAGRPDSKPDRYRTRSLAAGDVVLLADGHSTRAAFAVAPASWKPVSARRVLAAARATARKARKGSR